MDFPITQTKMPKTKPDFNNLGFGNYFTDHMFVLDYAEGQWQNPRIEPYAKLSIDPAAMVLHYGQEVFEGLKAYGAGDRTLLFRPMENIRRLNNSNARLCIPQLDEELVISAIKAIVRQDIDWVPNLPGTSLYIRPFIFANDPFLGVRASYTYKFLIILSPVGAYYPEGLAPVKILVEDEDVRAVRGGTGFAKAGCNYAASIRAQNKAKDKGYIQVLWLDGVERKYVEEVGSMNVFFKIGGEVIAPKLEGSILPGVTRKSVIELLDAWNIPCVQRRLSIDEIYAAAENGTLEEAFGTGTAAVVSPMGELCFNDRCIQISGGKIGQLSQRLYDELTGIQWGNRPDPFGWTMEI